MEMSTFQRDERNMIDEKFGQLKNVISDVIQSRLDTLSRNLPVQQQQQPTVAPPPPQMLMDDENYVRVTSASEFDFTCVSLWYSRPFDRLL